MIFLDIESDNPVPGAEPDAFQDRAVSIAIVRTSTPWIQSDFATPSIHKKLISVDFPLNRTEVHGLTNGDLYGQPRFAQIARSLHGIISEHEVIVTFNGNRYDIPLLWSEFDRAGIEWDTGRHKSIDLAALWQKAEPRTLSDAVKRMLGREHADAHTAEGDAGVLVELLPKFLDLCIGAGLISETAPLEEVAHLSRRTVKIGGEELETADLGGQLAWRDDRLVYTAKKVRGVEVVNDAGYGWWMLKQDFVGKDAKQLLKATLEGAQPERRRKAS